MFTQAMQNRLLDANDSVVCRALVPPAAGRYTLVAQLRSEQLSCAPAGGVLAALTRARPMCEVRSHHALALTTDVLGRPYSLSGAGSSVCMQARATRASSNCP